MPFRTTILEGTNDVGVPGTRILGVAWLLLALAFAAVAAGLTLRLAWWSQAAYVTIALSFRALHLGLARHARVDDVMLRSRRHTLLWR